MRQKDTETVGSADAAVSNCGRLNADWMLYRQLSDHAGGARSSAAANLFNATILGAAFTNLQNEA